MGVGCLEDVYLGRLEKASRSGGTHSPDGEDLGHMRDRLAGQAMRARGITPEVKTPTSILDVVSEEVGAAFKRLLALCDKHVNIYRSDCKTMPSAEVIEQTKADLLLISQAGIERAHDFLSVDGFRNWPAIHVFQWCRLALQQWEEQD